MFYAALQQWPYYKHSEAGVNTFCAVHKSSIAGAAMAWESAWNRAWGEAWNGDLMSAC
jgi:hypothetical protein